MAEIDSLLVRFSNIMVVHTVLAETLVQTFSADALLKNYGLQYRTAPMRSQCGRKHPSCLTALAMINTHVMFAQTEN